MPVPNVPKCVYLLHHKTKDRLSKYLTLLSTLVAGTTCHLTLKTSHLHCLHIILKNLSNVRPPANLHLEWESIYTLSTYLTCLCIYKKHSFNVNKHFTQTQLRQQASSVKIYEPEIHSQPKRCTCQHTRHASQSLTQNLLYILHNLRTQSPHTSVKE